MISRKKFAISAGEKNHVFCTFFTFLSYAYRHFPVLFVVVDDDEKKPWMLQNVLKMANYFPRILKLTVDWRLMRRYTSMGLVQTMDFWP